MNIIFYYYTRFAKNVCRCSYYADWGGLMTVFVITNYICAIVEVILGLLNYAHTDMYYYIILWSSIFLIVPIFFTEEKYEELDNKLHTSSIPIAIIAILMVMLLVLSIVCYVEVSDYFDICKTVDISQIFPHIRLGNHL